MDNKNIIQTRYATVRAPQVIDPENRSYEFVISTESPDSYGTVFRQSGWELDAYRANNIVSLNHATWSSDPDAAVIGTSTVRFENQEMIAVLDLEIGNPVADKVKRKLDNGTLKGASVGAQIHEAARGDFDKGENPDLVYFTRQTLVEWSVVPVPSNKDAIKRNNEGLEAFAKATTTPPTTTRNTAMLDEFDAAYMYNLNNK